MTEEMPPRTYHQPEEVPPWTPDAIAAAGNMGEITWAERMHYHQQPGMYPLAGSEPDPLHKDARRICEIAERRHYTAHWFKGHTLMIQAGNLAERWYVMFNRPDDAHDEEWFASACGGQDEYFDASDFDAFLTRMDIQSRRLVTETRNGFRVLVYSEPEA